MINVAGIEITPELVAFGGLATVAALAAIGVVAFNNAVRSALCLVVNFFLLAVLYFTLNAELLGISQVIVYTGAIMVLFLFVIMLLNLGAPQILHEKWDFKRPAGIVLALVFAGLIAGQILPSLMSASRPVSNPALDAYGSPQAIGRTLFSTYVFPFEAVSILLLIGIVGSILLAKRRI